MNTPINTQQVARASSRQKGDSVDLFQGLTHIPGNLIDTLLGGEPESQEAISEVVAARVLAISKAQETSELVVCEQIAERTGLSLDVVLSFVGGDMDLRDSLPLTRLQEVLGVRLCDL
jgi:hypothetical protein